MFSMSVRPSVHHHTPKGATATQPPPPSSSNAPRRPSNSRESKPSVAQLPATPLSEQPKGGTGQPSKHQEGGGQHSGLPELKERASPPEALPTIQPPVEATQSISDGDDAPPSTELAPIMARDPSLIGNRPAFEAAFIDSDRPGSPVPDSNLVCASDSEHTSMIGESMKKEKKEKKGGFFSRTVGRVAQALPSVTPQAKDKDSANFASKVMKNIKTSRATAIKTEDLSEDDAIIAVMGPTGAGKSSFVQIATGLVEGVGHSLESCTAEIRIIKMQHPDNNDASVVFVDTPGFDDTNKSDVEILAMVADWLKQTYQKQIKLAGILYFHRITDNRMAGTPLKNLKMFEKLCGEQAQKNIILTTTMWDSLPEEGDIGGQREAELKKTYWKSMIDNGSRTARFLNTYETAWKIVQPILISAELRQVVLLQQELVDQRMQVRETQAGKQMFSNLETLVERQKEMLQRLREETEDEADEDTLNLIRAEYETVRKELEKTMLEMQGMKIPFSRRFTRVFSRRLAFFKRLSS